eukprot:6774404-Prorocentrum_lima.AAC.1
MEDYLRVASVDDPLFQAMLPHIVRDLGWQSRVGRENLYQEVWDSLGDAQCFQAKGPKPKGS